jgi:hypothetical protein
MQSSAKMDALYEKWAARFPTTAFYTDDGELHVGEPPVDMPRDRGDGWIIDPRELAIEALSIVVENYGSFAAAIRAVRLHGGLPTAMFDRAAKKIFRGALVCDQNEGIAPMQLADVDRHCKFLFGPARPFPTYFFEQPGYDWEQNYRPEWWPPGCLGEDGKLKPFNANTTAMDIIGGFMPSVVGLSEDGLVMLCHRVYASLRRYNLTGVSMPDWHLRSLVLGAIYDRTRLRNPHMDMPILEETALVMETVEEDPALTQYFLAHGVAKVRAPRAPRTRADIKATGPRRQLTVSAERPWAGKTAKKAWKATKNPRPARAP